MTRVCPSGDRRWNHILRAALQVLLPLECPGSGGPWQMRQIKERMRQLIVYHWPHTQFGQGVSNILSTISRTTCIHCGQPAACGYGLGTPGVRRVLGRGTVEDTAAFPLEEPTREGATTAVHRLKLTGNDGPDRADRDDERPARKHRNR